MTEKNKQPDPRTAEAQLYQRIETARAQIAGAVNQAMQETGMPTAIILELLRGIVAETSLMLERAGRAARETEIREAVGSVREAAKSK